MKRFQNLTVRGFRRLADVDLELRPLTVLIGANGVGKTSVLDALSILASSAQGNLNAAVSEMSGLSAMMTYDRASEVGFGISMTVPTFEPLDYSLSLRSQGVAYLINRETLQQRQERHPSPLLHIDSHGTDIKYFEVDQGRLVRPNWEHNPLEGETERVFLPHLREFLSPRLQGKMPRLISIKYDGRIDKQEKLKRVVDTLLRGGNPDADHVIALTDVYTGSNDFQDAADAKRKMRKWVGPNECFHPHVAQYDFEAWLLPYWPDIQRLARHNRTAPSGVPESVNHNHPPSYHLKEIFRTGKSPRHYSKTRDAKRILQGKELSVSAAACPELRAFLNTILTSSQGDPI